MIGYSRTKFVRSVQTEEDDQTKVKMLAPFDIVLYEYVLFCKISNSFVWIRAYAVFMGGEEQFNQDLNCFMKSKQLYIES